MSDFSNSIGHIFTHNNGKYYKVIGFAIIEATETHAVIYKCLNSSVLLVRPSSEFFDGRFKFFGTQA